MLSVFLLTLAACGGDGENVTESTEEAQAEPEEDSGEAVSDESELDLSTVPPFTVPMTSPGLEAVALLAAVDRLREQGLEVETPILEDTGLIMDGLARNEFQFSSGSTSGAVLAISKDAPMAIIGERTANEWLLASVADIQSCEDLKGVEIGVHFEASADRYLTSAWMEQECPDIEPQFIIVRGSDNRTTALLTGQVEAATQETMTGTQLQLKGGDDFHFLARFKEDLPPLHPSTIYGNVKFMEENPDAATALLVALMEVHREIADNPDYLLELANEHLDVETIGEDTIETAADIYLENELLDPNLGNLTMDSIQETLDVMLPDVEGVDAEGVANLEYFENALSILGEA